MTKSRWCTPDSRRWISKTNKVARRWNEARRVVYRLSRLCQRLRRIKWTSGRATKIKLGVSHATLVMAVLVNTAVDLATLLTPLLGPSGLNLEITIAPLGKRPLRGQRNIRNLSVRLLFFRTNLHDQDPQFHCDNRFNITFISRYSLQKVF